MYLFLVVLEEFSVTVTLNCLSHLNKVSPVARELENRNLFTVSKKAGAKKQCLDMSNTLRPRE